MLIRRKSLAPISIKYSTDSGTKSSLNQYSDIADDFYDGGLTVTSDLTTELTDSEIIELLANLEENRQDVSDFMLYNYITNGNVYQLYNMFKTLPKLEYRIGAFDNNVSQYMDSVNLINKVLFKLHYKEMLRDIISQSCLDGGTVCVWCGSGENVFPYIFDSCKYVYPKYKRAGEWVCVVDLALLSELKDEEKLNLFENLKPMVTEAMFKKYQSNPSKETQFIELPQEKTSYIRNGNVLRFNQRIGVPFGTQSLLDINHKKRLKGLDDVIAGKANKAFATLQIGSDKENKSFIDIPKNVRRSIVNGVGNALKQSATSSEDGKIPLAVVPEFCNLKMDTIDGLEGLTSDKYSIVSEDINNDTGIGNGIAYGVGSNNAGTEANINYVYRRIGVILEQLDGFLNKLIPLVCSGTDGDSLFIELDKDAPLTKSERLEALFKLQAEGFSTSHIVQELGINFSDYIEQTLREVEELQLQNRVIPYASSYTRTDATGEQTSTEDNATQKQDKTKKQKTKTDEGSGDNAK